MNGSDALLPGRAGRRRAERLVLAVAVTGTVLIALGAFWLSFTSLSELARRCGIAPDRAWVWPLIVDGVIVVATVSVVAMSGGGWDRRAVRYAWTLLLAGACVSVLANASHAIVAVDARVPSVLAALVAAVPPVVLVAITHLTVELTQRPASGPAARVRAAAPPTPRRSGGPARVNRVDQGGSVGEALRLRAQTSMTNREIAARLGVHPSTVGRWLKPDRAAALGAGEQPVAEQRMVEGSVTS
ncbi:MAG: DUF2637 domain-containing protein [Solirubrobacteraceae bacterium]